MYYNKWFKDDLRKRDFLYPSSGTFSRERDLFSIIAKKVFYNIVYFKNNFYLDYSHHIYFANETPILQKQ